MIKEILKYSLHFILLVLLQGLILNNIQFDGYINPFLYVLFILSLPFDTPNWLVILLGFTLGISVDIFTSTLGMHTSATVFLAFVRQFYLKIIEPRDGYEFGDKPNIFHMGIVWYLSYAGVLVLVHHLFLFFVEAFKFSQFFQTISRTIMSFLFTMMLIFIAQLFNYKPANKT